ncbi:hypothetical protein HMPREF0239_01926 [Clostridium sp. ATCC BAA-442]|nr:hypothetical protein HMPREF0239_01926 [Clostridium sp. ATCC BAA-442]
MRLSINRVLYSKRLPEHGGTPPCSPTGAIRAERQNHPLITEGRPPPAAAGLAV